MIRNTKYPKGINEKIQNAKLSRGFTLIELLIVISIIGVLAAILMSNFVGIRQRGRDAQRKSNIRQIQSALELYRSDQSNYPPNKDFNNCGPNVSLTDDNKPPNATYMQTIPCDPLGGIYQYSSPPNGTSYTLVACLENGNDSEIDQNPPKGFNCPVGHYFDVTNP